MPPYHLSSTSRALYHVFVEPTLASPFRNAAIPFLQPAVRFPVLPKITIRARSYKKEVKRQALSDYYTIDKAIQGPVISLINEDGSFTSHFPLAKVSYNRTLYHLVQLAEGKVDASGNPDPAFPPKCKIVSKMEMRQQLQKKLDIERRSAKGKGAGPSPKNLELNWAIAPGDLKHRLEKLKEFMKEGRKVELLMGIKRKGKKATDAECHAVLAKVREAVAECKGALEVKEPSGKLGGTMTLIFEGKKIEEKEKKAEN